MDRRLSKYPHLRAVRTLIEKEFHRKQLFSGLKILAYVLALHFITMAVCGILLQIYPLALSVFKFLLLLYALYIVIPIYMYRQYRKYSQSSSALAFELDKLNPQRADIFRTNLSLQNHDNNTLERMNAYYGGFLDKLILPRLNVSWALLALVGGALALWVMGGIFSPQPPAYFSQTLNPWGGISQVPVLSVSIKADKNIVGKGDTVHVKGFVTGDLPGQKLYAYVKTKQTEIRYPVTVKAHEISFRYASDIDYQIRVGGENGKSQPIRVKVLDKPNITRIQAVIEPPQYTKLKTDTLAEGRTNFSVYPGSHVHWFLSTNRKSSIHLKVKSNDSSKIPELERLVSEEGETYTLTRKFFDGKQAQKKAQKKQPAVAVAGLPWNYTFQLTDEHGIQNSSSIYSVVHLKKDEYPHLEIVQPDDYSKIHRSEKIPVSLIVSDDFGLNFLKVNYKVSSDGILKDSASLNISKLLKQRKGNYLSYVWDLAEFDLRPENRIHFYFTLCDNDVISGPKCISSENRVIHYPSIREIMKEAEVEKSAAVTSLKSASERQKNISKKLKRLKEGLSEETVRIPSYEARKILINEPGRLKRQVRKAIERIEQDIKLPQNEKVKKQLARSLKNFKQKAKNLDQNIPEQDILNESSEKKLAALDKLTKAHENLSQSLDKLEKKMENTGSEKRENWKQQNTPMKQQMEKNLTDQKNLKEFLQSEKEQNQLKEKLKEELLAEQQKSVEDMKQSIDDLESFLEKSMKDELFSEELLEKMEKIQELLKETLPDSLLKLMEKKMEGEQVKAEDIQESLEKLLNNKESFEQNIDRALHQLQKVKELMKMETWKKELEELSDQQKSLHKKIAKLEAKPSAGEKEKMTRGQQEIKDAFQKTAQEMNTEKSFQKQKPGELSQENQKKLMDTMESVKSNLNKPAEGKRSSASKDAKSAQKQLESMVQALSQKMQGMGGQMASIDPYQIQVLVYESIDLIRLQQLIPQSDKRRKGNGWDSDPVTLYSHSLQVARWLYQSLQKLSVEFPMVSPYLLAQARLLAAALEKASTERNLSEAKRAIGYNQNVSRELLKLLNFAKNMPQGSGQGQGSQGNESDGMNSQSEPSDGKGLSESLKGLSGKQLALNQSTNELLKSMLQSRKFEQGRGKGQKGTGQKHQEGGTPQQLANEQGQMSESLESMAESAGTEGGAATKLRKLAEEARGLEKEMRRGAITPDLAQKQERFKSRLLETSKALEERGFSSKREGKFSKQFIQDNKVYPGSQKKEWLLLLEKEKARIKKMPMKEKERKNLSLFFETLFTQ